MARRVRLPLRAAAVVITAASLTSVGLVVAAPASVADVQSQINSAKKQLAQLDNQAQAASDRYDAAVIKLTSAQTNASKANDALKSAQGKVSALQQKVAGFAAAEYRGEAPSLVDGLITDGSADTFVSRLSTMQAVSSSETQTLSAVTAAHRVEQQAQINSKAALANQKTATASLSADRNQILSAANKEKSLLGSLVTKEQAIEKAAKVAAVRQAAAAAAAQLQARERATATATSVVAQSLPSATSTTPSSPPPPSGSGGAHTAVEWAYREIGKPYVYGAAGPNSFDCSGLVQYVWGKAGVYLSHYTGSQYSEGTHVSRSQLEPGDLVFFVGSDGSYSAPGHVGIYIGGGQMIDAPYTGVNVRIDPLQSDYVGATRP
jgi:cell wall-associated NlpC family hydrolase